MDGETNTRSGRRPVTSTTDVRNRRSAAIIAVLIGIRLVLAAVVGFGPWTDEPTELAGWDAERFVAIAEGPQPWRSTPVEYPPGSVLVIEALHRLAGPLSAWPVVAMNRSLVIIGLFADLATAALVGRVVGRWEGRHGARQAIVAYLMIGSIVLPMGWLRLDQLSALMATAALALFTLSGLRSRWFGLTVMAGAAVKIWPALAIIVAVSNRRWRPVAASLGWGVAAVAAWLVWTDAGLEPVRQVTTLREATGWHVESTVGALIALLGEEPARTELNAFRIGNLSPVMVAVLRGLGLLVIAGIGVLASKVRRSDGSEQPGRPGERSEPVAGPGDPVPAATVMIGMVATLLVTAPLLSPQFVTWLIPFAAIAFTDHRSRLLAVLVALSATVTGLTSLVFGPPNLDQTLPAALMTVRNGLLVAVVGQTAVTLRRFQRPVG